MKKGGILNPAICSLLAELGHMDELLIVDAGYPLPPDAHVIDLTLTPGIPRFLDVLRAVAEELVIESITVASEITEFSPKLYQEILKIVGDVDVDEVPHHEFKEQSHGRQGDHPHGRVHPLRQRPDPVGQRVLTDPASAQSSGCGVVGFLESSGAPAFEPREPRRGEDKGEWGRRDSQHDERRGAALRPGDVPAPVEEHRQSDRHPARRPGDRHDQHGVACGHGSARQPPRRP